MPPMQLDPGPGGPVMKGRPLFTHDIEVIEQWLRFWYGRRIETVRLGPGSGL